MKRYISEKKRKIFLVVSIVFWVLFWWTMSTLIKEKLFLPSPYSVLKALISLFPKKEFWTSIAFSTSRVVLSYLVSFIVAALLGVFGGLSERIEILLSPIVESHNLNPVFADKLIQIIQIIEECPTADTCISRWVAFGKGFIALGDKVLDIILSHPVAKAIVKNPVSR